MRNELELIEKIEQYLNDQLSPDERAAFEQQMAGDPQLKEDVLLQQELMKGIERTNLKQQIRQAKARFNGIKNFTKWGLTGLGIAVILGVVYYYVHNNSNVQQTYDGKALPAYNEAGEKQWADADRNMAAQMFSLQAGRDTVIETKAGITVSIPANGFLDETGKPVNGGVDLVVKEALDASSIMRAGLSSMSGDQLLESGGMFFIDARKGGKRITINPAAGLYVEVPADTVKPGMQLYNGKRTTDGTIDWVNPRPLEHDLVPVDILLLDFYPPHYLDSLGKWGYDRQDKNFTDSLYYSFSRFFGPDIPPAEPAFAEEGDSSTDKRVKLDTAMYYNEGYPYPKCGINPAKIKTIWSTAFQNTLLSTREFEQRIPWIHVSGDNKVLDLYINNLDKNLSAIDSMAAMRLSGNLKKQFLSFAAREDGKVKNGSKSFQMLRDYYQAKTQAYMRAVAKTQAEFWKKQAVLDNLADKKQMEHQKDSVNRVAQNFIEELNVNVKEAYRQLGYDSSLTPRFTYNNVYRAQVTTTGWYNVDKVVYESVRTRTTLDFTDSATGKKAIIKYLPVSFQVEQSGEYDRLYVYLLPDQLSSFMRLDGSNGTYTEKLDELMQYDLVCIAWKGEQAFMYKEEHIKPGDHSGIRLTAISQPELEHTLQQIGSRSQGAAIKQELEYFQFDSTDQKRKQQNEALQELTWKLRRFLFPCELVEMLVITRSSPLFSDLPPSEASLLILP